MEAQAEFYNPTKVPVKLLGPDHKIITVPPNGHVVLSTYFIRFTPGKLKFVKYIVGNLTKVQPKPKAAIAPPTVSAPKPAPVLTNKPVTVNEARNKPKPKPIRHRAIIRTGRPLWKNSRVGRPLRSGIKPAFIKAAIESSVPVSNNIGIGILSYNRFASLQRLVESIVANTDLKRTTLFISDESNNLTAEQVAWLESLDACVMIGQPRLGIAGNTNRLLRCLQRFKWGIILNDDVEILKPQWEFFYVNAMAKSGINHFCFRELGVYGAAPTNVTVHDVNGVSVETITEKPHGAVLAFTKTALDAVGYFDESFGIYGMEHVDWSERIAKHFGISGFHDVSGSSEFFMIHAETSAVENRIEHLNKSREQFALVRNTRVKVSASPKSEVPSATIVIPFRNTGRNDDLITVVANMRAQRYPNIEISIVEHSAAPEAVLKSLNPVTYAHIPSGGGPFNKSKAFNRGALRAVSEKLILQDADIIIDGDYVRDVANLLDTYDSCHLGSEVYYLTEGSTNILNGTCILRSDYEVNRVVDYFEGGSLGITKKAYVSIGGFDETFEGYGVEDCAFYTNMSKLTKYKDQRMYRFFHLWHDRTIGWEACHKKNREYYAMIQRQFKTFREYADHLIAKLKKF